MSDNSSAYTGNLKAALRVQHQPSAWIDALSSRDTVNGSLVLLGFIVVRVVTSYYSPNEIDTPIHFCRVNIIVLSLIKLYNIAN